MVRKTFRNKQKIKTIVTICLIVLLLPILVANLTLIIKGSVNKEVPPDLFGIAPMAVTSGSMSGENSDSFEQGALIFIKLLSDEEISKLREGEIITFLSSGAYVTHRIVSVNIDDSDKVVSFVTKGDANTVTDGAIPVENVIGKCIGSIGGLGGFAMFMQTPAGILVFVGIPVLLYIVYDVLRIVVYNKRQKEDKNEELQEKDEEIKRLRSLVEGQSGSRDSGNAAFKGEDDFNA